MFFSEEKNQKTFSCAKRGFAGVGRMQSAA
jgi:hypothetical protein